MYRLMIEIQYRVGDTVYLRCDADCSPGIMTGYCIGGNAHESSILYSVAWSNHTETRHYGIELSPDPCPHYLESVIK